MQRSVKAPSKTVLSDLHAGRRTPAGSQSVWLAAIRTINAITPRMACGITSEWEEQDIVFLHWRLLKEVEGLRDPATPLEEKLDTLRWIFTESEKENLPFSFVSCLKVVGCSPLSPLPYCGQLDAEEIRDAIRYQVGSWLNATLNRYPSWVRDAVLRNPTWIESRLAKNPQWLNEQVRKHAVQSDLFA